MKISYNKITLLGTGTCQIQHNRMASSILVELDHLKLVYDFGRGVTLRLNELGLQQDDIRHIVLSHFHPDHLSDLIPFLHAAANSRIDPRTVDLNIYGPIGVKVQIMRLLSLFGVGDLAAENFEIYIHEIRNNTFTIEQKEFCFIDLPPANNHGLKFVHNEKIYAFTGDSNFHQQEIDFLRDVDLAVIDAGHLSDDDIISLSALSQAKIIVCSHQYKELNENELNLKAQRNGFRGKLIVGKDLMDL